MKTMTMMKIWKGYKMKVFINNHTEADIDYKDILNFVAYRNSPNPQIQITSWNALLSCYTRNELSYKGVSMTDFFEAIQTIASSFTHLDSKTIDTQNEKRLERIEELQSRIGHCNCTIDELKKGIHEMPDIESAISYQYGQILAYEDELNFLLN